MNNTNNQPPFLGQGKPNYPVHIQALRVTGGVVPGPSGLMVSSMRQPSLYASFVQQIDPDTILPRDREPCLVLDMNGYGLMPGFYDGRLVGNYNGLPVYAVGGSTPFVPFVLPTGISSTVTIVTSAIPAFTSSTFPTPNVGLTPQQIQSLSTLSPTQATVLNNLSPCQLQVLLEALPISQIQLLTLTLTPTQLTTFVNTLTTVELINLYSQLTLSQILKLTSVFTYNEVTTLYQILTPQQISVTLTSLTVTQLQLLITTCPCAIQTLVSDLTPTELATLLSNLTPTQLVDLGKFPPVVISVLTTNLDITQLTTLLNTDPLPTNPVETSYTQTPAFTTGTQNDLPVYAPVLTIATTGPTVITGFVPVDYDLTQTVVIENKGASTITVSHQNAGSLTQNRVYSSTGSDLTIPAKGSLTILYNPSTGYWADVGASVSMAGTEDRSDGTLAATGSTQGDAAPITTDGVVVTGADGTKGVILPDTSGGILTLWNDDLFGTLNVYPPVGGAINTSATNVARTVGPKTGRCYGRVSATQWIELRT